MTKAGTKDVEGVDGAKSGVWLVVLSLGMIEVESGLVK